MKKLAAILMVVLLLGCATAMDFRPNPQDRADSNFGPYPDNYKEITKEYLSRNLFDPYSAVYTFNAPLKVRMAGGPSPFGWAVCGTINAKNRLGGYVGAGDYLVKIRDGVVVYDMSGSVARDVCEAIK
jgi:hypothetical protein